MTQQIKNKVSRLHYLHKLLLENLVSLHDIQERYVQMEVFKSKRQIQRDLNDVLLFLQENEHINYHYIGKIKYFHIHKKPSLQKEEKDIYTAPFPTQFYTAKWNNTDEMHLELIQNAIKTGHVIQIGRLKNDETGDNVTFSTKHIQIIPVSIIEHRNSYFVGGFNKKENRIVFYSIRQLDKLKTLAEKCTPNLYQEVLEQELHSRFGITKNINSEIYTIKIEIANVLSDFLQNHFWHPTQHFSKKRGKTILTLQCGINRELIGWLFQWMYNIKIIEPRILRDYYEKSLFEITAVNQARKPLVYRNIF
jgi:predicted DNA-binding transcriptional regulator YafY